MPPGYGYLTRHLYTGRLTLGEAVQTTNRRVLVLENEEKTRLRAEKYIHVQAPKAAMNKTPAFKVPLQTELRFHLRRYEQPHSMGGPAEQQKADGRLAMQAACNRAKWAHFSDFQHAQHGGPGPRVMQPARQMLRACNCTATCATTAPPRLRNQYRDSRRPSARPSSASLARRSMRPKMGRQ
jgi:hypothetical protein